MRRLLMALAVAGLFAGCSNGDGTDSTETPAAPSPTAAVRVLVLETGDFTEDEWRAEVHSTFVNAGASELCELITDLTPAEIVAMEDRLREEGEIDPATQEGDPEDRLLAAEIWQEECARLQ